MTDARTTGGRFISLEGGEGAGKSTQLSALAAALRARGLEVVETREPGGSEGAEAIRALLLTGGADRWSPRAEALLFAAARADHVEKTIRPALERGAWVLSDRFLDSSRAYQGMGSLTDADILALHRIGSDGFLPDRTLFLTLAEEEASARAQSRDGDAADRIGGRDRDFHRAVSTAFHRFAQQEPARFLTVDASGEAEAVTARLLHALQDLLP
ncbi:MULTISPECIES: dTMP kinase [Sphingobium]|uniref:Thymidylate kinase n=2 Tax=Sphingobium fuliginis (strain ATCC 27551) TaxID=336203 RepID=A0A292ZF23_SPHSA|nr:MULTISPECIES: dTMP kinase [Sphingobium]PNQ03852.1 dTMP kinase [Sphingobium sp. SA916]QDC37030.1 dTMP kinase [Sphingobium fuliginis ATCC 27551]MCB4860103.1 dTMP kinase [Sphingobium sp. PNB]QOT72603.1 dTMP kinase [Sphingobium fuliginis]GAY21435.1 thymidylate kinase [Sphingobium fuliginis]